MPPKRKSQPKKKKQHKKDAWGGVNLTQSIKGVGFPAELRCRLSYYDLVVRGLSSAPAAYVFNMNGLFKPNESESGHQPIYFDVLKNIWEEYYVIGASAHITMVNASTASSQDAILVVVELTTETSDYAVDAIYMMEHKYVRHVELGGTSSGTSNRTLKIPYMSTDKIYGEKFTQADSRCCAGSGANPTRLWQMAIKAANVLPGGNNITVYFGVRIVFDVIFRQLNIPADSAMSLSKMSPELQMQRIKNCMPIERQKDVQLPSFSKVINESIENNNNNMVTKSPMIQSTYKRN